MEVIVCFSNPCEQKAQAELSVSDWVFFLLLVFREWISLIWSSQAHGSDCGYRNPTDPFFKPFAYEGQPIRRKLSFCFSRIKYSAGNQHYKSAAQVF